MQILAETPTYLVLNKPAGIAVHGDGKTQEETVVDFLVKNNYVAPEIGEPFIVFPEGTPVALPRAGIVHRLDRDTTGCLLVAKTDEAFLFFKEQFQEHTIQKYYEAFVYGWPRDERGVIETLFGRAHHSARLRTSRGPRGAIRQAITRFVVMKKFEDETGKKFAFVGLYPKTGRTHQLRVHMVHIHTPIVSDALYAPRREHALSFDRVALHARRLIVPLMGGKSATFEAPYPEDFQKALKTHITP